MSSKIGLETPSDALSGELSWSVARWRRLSVLGGIVSAFAPGQASALPAGFGSNCSFTGGTTAAAGPSDATSIHSSSISGACGSNSTASSGQVDVFVTTDAGPNIYSFVQSATTSAGARASMGNLGAFSDSSAISNPEAYLFTSGGAGAIVENEYVATGSSSAVASWWDQMTVGGTANASGFVVLSFTLDLHGSTFATPTAPGSARIESRLFINDFDRFNGSIIDLTEPGSFSQTIGFRPGQQVQLYGDLNVFSNALAGRDIRTVCSGFVCFPFRGGYFPDTSAGADAADTAGFHIDVVTPGGTYSTLSGTSYLTVAAVPEPSTWALLTAGLLGIARLGRRRAGR